MKAAILSVFDNRLVTSATLVSLKLVDTEVTLTLANTYYVKYGVDAQAATELYEQTAQELLNFRMMQFDEYTSVNIDAVVGAWISEPTVTKSKYTVYLLVGRTKLTKCADTKEEALEYINSIATLINGETP